MGTMCHIHFEYAPLFFRVFEDQVQVLVVVRPLTTSQLSKVDVHQGFYPAVDKWRFKMPRVSPFSVSSIAPYWGDGLWSLGILWAYQPILYSTVRQTTFSNLIGTQNKAWQTNYKHTNIYVYIYIYIYICTGIEICCSCSWYTPLHLSRAWFSIQRNG